MVLWERSPAVRRPQNLKTGLRECWTLEKTLSATSSTAISRPTPFLKNSTRSTQRWNRESWSKRRGKTNISRCAEWVSSFDPGRRHCCNNLTLSNCQNLTFSPIQTRCSSPWWKQCRSCNFIAFVLTFFTNLGSKEKIVLNIEQWKAEEKLWKIYQNLLKPSYDHAKQRRVAYLFSSYFCSGPNSPQTNRQIKSTWAKLWFCVWK